MKNRILSPNFMKCKECKPLLSDWLDERVDKETEKRLKQHLDECSLCSEYYVRLKKTVDTVRHLPRASLPNSFATLVRRRIEEDRKNSLLAQRTLYWRLKVAASFLLTISVVPLCLILWHRDHSPNSFFSSQSPLAQKAKAPKKDMEAQKKAMEAPAIEKMEKAPAIEKMKASPTMPAAPLKQDVSPVSQPVLPMPAPLGQNGSKVREDLPTGSNTGQNVHVEEELNTQGNTQKTPTMGEGKNAPTLEQEQVTRNMGRNATFAGRDAKNIAEGGHYGVEKGGTMGRQNVQRNFVPVNMQKSQNQYNQKSEEPYQEKVNIVPSESKKSQERQPKSEQPCQENLADKENLGDKMDECGPNKREPSQNVMAEAKEQGADVNVKEEKQKADEEKQGADVNVKEEKQKADVNVSTAKHSVASECSKKDTDSWDYKQTALASNKDKEAKTPKTKAKMSNVKITLVLSDIQRRQLAFLIEQKDVLKTVFTSDAIVCTGNDASAIHYKSRINITILSKDFDRDFLKVQAIFENMSFYDSSKDKYLLLLGEINLKQEEALLLLAKLYHHFEFLPTVSVEDEADIDGKTSIRICVAIVCKNEK